MNVKIKNFRCPMNQFLLVIIYKIILDISYVMFEAPNFGYMGFSYKFNWLKILITWLIYLLYFSAIKTEKNGIVTLFSYMSFALSMAPFMTIYQFMEECPLWMVILQVSALLFINVAATRGEFYINKSSFPAIPYYSKRISRVFSAYLVLFFLYAFYKFGMPAFEFLGFDSISTIRASAELSTLDSIVTNISCRVIVPLYILMAWNDKKYGKAFFGLVIQVYIFSVTGFKTFLFIPIVMAGLVVFKRLDLKRVIFVGLSGALFLVGVIYSLTNNLMPYALIGDRTVFFPALIKFAYMDFFSKNEFVYFSQNSISKILGIRSNYTVNVPNLIGEEYFNKAEMWTNTGFIADAYSNLGVVGVLIIAFCIIVVLALVSRKVERCQGKMKSAITTIYILYFVMLNDGPFISTFFSGGMVIALLITIVVDFNDRKGENILKSNREI